MREKQDIPESILNDLIELYGQEKTDRILNNRLIDFQLIILMILRKKFILRFKIYPEIIILFIAVIVVSFYLFY